MTHLRCSVTMLAALSIAGAATAAEEWKTITLRGEPGLTVSIPAVAEDMDSDAKNPDDLMFFSVEAGGHGGLTCMASRSDYPEGATQAIFAAKLATELRELFCGQSSESVSNVSIGGSESFTRNGLQGAICTASYTDSAEELPGRVESQLVIAAPRKIYLLTCYSEDEDQDTAEYEWVSLWEEKVRHIQDSFTVPAR